MAHRPLVWMGLQKKPPRSHVAFSARESQPRSSKKSPSSSSHSYVSGLSLGMTCTVSTRGSVIVRVLGLGC